MNAALLLEHYERIVEAPDAIARLRRFVLDLAVRGKLVEQDPNDEPASELVKSFIVERGARIAKKEMRNSKPLNSLEEYPFDVPESWVWLPLGETGNIFSGNSINESTRERLSQTSSGRPFIATKDVGYGLDALAYDNGLLVPEADTTFKVVRPNTPLICSEGGSAGRKIGLCDRAICFGNKLIANEPWSQISPKYILYVYLSPFFYEEFRLRMTGVIGGISLNRFVELPFPLPPVAEQERIVSKVDELMALCDQLEAAQADREAGRDKLTLSALAKLNEPDPETFGYDARFSLEHLEPLMKRTDQIKRLRQTILNLAVRGKLVVQDAGDEPAATMFQRVQSERARMAKVGITPRPKESARDPDFLADGLPTSWLPIALGDVCSLVTSGSRGWGEYYAETGPGFVRAQNIRFGKLRLEGLARVNPPAKAEGARTQVAKGDLLIVITGAGVTNPALLDIDLGEAYVSQHVGLVRPCDTELSPWLLLCLMADAGGRAELTMRAYGAGKPGLNLDNIRSLSVPLPPLTEQHRIVSKVDELMALCDQLEDSLFKGEQICSKLLEAVLHEALEPA